MLVTLNVAVLFARFGSGSVATTLTVLESVPGAVTITLMMIVAFVPLGKLPRLQVTLLPLAVQLPCVAVAASHALQAYALDHHWLLEWLLQVLVGWPQLFTLVAGYFYG